MDLVSIKKFLRPGKPKADDYVRFLQLLLQGISLHAVEADEYEFSQFRGRVDGIADRLSEQSSAEDILAAMGTAIGVMAEYNRKVTKSGQAHRQELHSMLGMMTETIAFLSASCTVGVGQLQTVERSLKKASSLEDVRELKARLDDCLTMVRQESTRLHDESEARISVLRKSVERTISDVRAAEANDPADAATGLPGRGAAEQLIATKLAQAKEFVITLFVVDRLAHVNGRFGRKTGDEVLLQVAQHIGQRLEGLPLFRWTGPVLATVVDGKPSMYAVERQMKQIAAMRLEKTIATDGRFVLLPLTCSYLLQKVAPGDAEEVIARNLDRFVFSHIGAGETEPDGG